MNRATAPFRKLLSAKKTATKTPRELFAHVFDMVQLSRALIDSKTFVDCTPKKTPAEVQKHFSKHHGADMSIREFVKENFDLPEQPSAPHADIGVEAPAKEIRAYIEHMWKELTRIPDEKKEYSSLLPLPYRYVVPGGRFRELYYWDSYFTMLGLKESSHHDLLKEMVDNFAHLIDTYGFIPNGTRTYYLTRSQPPVFAHMVDLLRESGDTNALPNYLPSMLAEYRFWMRGLTDPDFQSKKTNASEHVVRLRGGEILNRYFDSGIGPREESFAEDVESAREADHSTSFYKNIRAGAESGWDFSSRWFRDNKNISTVCTTELVPPDLNALLYQYELIIASAYNSTGNTAMEREFKEKAEARKHAMHTYLWSEKHEWFCDYFFEEDRQSDALSLAGMYPLFAGLATTEQASASAQTLEKLFLRPGGVVTTFVHSGEQWDAPNGWAPAEYITVIGLENYGFSKLAEDIATRWCHLVIKTFERIGTLLEKYNVEDERALATGGEYALQDGFGWTNGVQLALMNRYNIKK